jgi:WD40 repeat protein
VGHPKVLTYATDFTISGWEDGALRVYFADPHNYDAVTHEGAQGLVAGRGYGGAVVGGRHATVDAKSSTKEAVGITTRRAGHEDRGFLWAIPGAHSAAQGGISAVALSHNKRFVVSGGEDSRVRVWDMRSREMVRVPSHTPGCHALSHTGTSKNVPRND